MTLIVGGYLNFKLFPCPHHLLTLISECPFQDNRAREQAISIRRKLPDKRAHGLHARKFCLQLARDSVRALQGGRMEQGPGRPSVSRRATACARRGRQKGTVCRLRHDEEGE